jgi:uncharacterized protein YcfJ
MRKTVLTLGLIAALTTPSLAMARSHCEASSHNRKVTGTVLGAAGGALIGGALGHGAAAPLLGAAGGAVVGNQLARKKCASYHSYHRHHRYDHRG